MGLILSPKGTLQVVAGEKWTLTKLFQLQYTPFLPHSRSSPSPPRFHPQCLPLTFQLNSECLSFFSSIYLVIALISGGVFFLTWKNLEHCLSSRNAVLLFIS